MKSLILSSLNKIESTVQLWKAKLVKPLATKSVVINALAPKVLTAQDELKRISPYLESLKSALESEDLNNIAITGGYGSGKSTILKTFQFLNKQFKYLNISLASFSDDKEDKEDFERKLEVSILQQMFYHVKPDDIPDSRFKRIVNLKSNDLIIRAAFLIVWIFSCLILFKFDYINKLNPTTWRIDYKIDFIALTSSIVLFFGIGLFIKSAYRLFSNSKINKVNIKGELELAQAADKSVFNQHLEEILYFFERTDYNVVIRRC